MQCSVRALANIKWKRLYCSFKIKGQEKDGQSTSIITSISNLHFINHLYI